MGVNKAPGNKYLKIGMFTLQTFQQAQSAQDLILGALSYNACIENHQIGIGERRRCLIAGAVQESSYLLGFRLIHLAADGPNKIACHVLLS
jgi:hypothetical protein